MPSLGAQKIFSLGKRGITLVELLIVVAIVSILAAAVVVAVNPAKRMGQARDSTRKANLSVVSRALLAYYLDRQTYPDPGASHFTESTTGVDWIPGLRPDYLKTLPTDPKQAALPSYFAKLFPTPKNQLSTQKGQVAGASSAQRPHGLFLPRPGTCDTNGVCDFNLSTGLLNNPLIDGFSLAMDWSAIEGPAKGQWHFSGLDAAISSITAKNKQVALRFYTGSAAPDYIMTNPSVKKLSLNSVVPWDPIMIAAWADVVAELGNRYRGQPWLQRVGISGPTLNWLEIVPTDLTCTEFSKWITKGYTDQKLYDAWVTTINAYNIAFPNDYLSIAFRPLISSTATTCPGTDPVPDMDNSNPSDHSSSTEPTRRLANYAYNTLGSRFLFQTSNFSDTFPNLANPNNPETKVYNYEKAIAQQTKTGLQLGENHMSIQYPDPGNLDAYRAALCKVNDLELVYLETANYRFGDTDLAPDLAAIEAQLLINPVASSCGLPAPTPTPGVTPTPAPTPTPGPVNDFKYRYFSADLQTFQLWAILEDKDDKETYPHPGRTCQKTPPTDNLNYNYCVAY